MMLALRPTVRTPDFDSGNACSNQAGPLVVHLLSEEFRRQRGVSVVVFENVQAPAVRCPSFGQ